jgi:hypothetical protein
MGGIWQLGGGSVGAQWGTTFQPQKGACGQSSTAPVGPSWRHLAVGPTPPADWDTRSTRSHLGKRPKHEVPGFCPWRGGPGVRPVLGQVPPGGAGAKKVWVRDGLWRGSGRQCHQGRGGNTITFVKKVASKVLRIREVLFAHLLPIQDENLRYLHSPLRSRHYFRSTM